MKKISNFLLLFVIFVFAGCGSNKYIAPRMDDENLVNFSLFAQQMPNEIPLLGAAPTNEVKSSPFIIHNPLSSALTVWALAPGNWVWGYTLQHSKTFGEVRIWTLTNLGNNIVMIVNQLTKTCLSEHGSGVTHERCNRDAKAQQWGLLPMDNSAFQIMSMSTRRCITTENGSIIDTERYYSITMSSCSTAPNYNQQWRFLAPTYYATPLYD